ncbi:uncharacterized protein MELLADRAFT_123554 [Melampsora larici-populina 98AG31]|uniref:Secreted protein n=1 Tax=Melampsora larici-populina (strain 98AG31 / pathotype 3-4-7) TaxID=747676 RepID=F4S9W3_MELLP|nr:uncharacterized protein MELLADRAFT_123554 [Melampsora larici-populina 98AG31]EGF98592.1 secreted protein [Melampsora larici-populina 98AG31]
MSWIQSSPIFYLLLVVLLAGDLGSHIFANANAIDCTRGWSVPTPAEDNKYLCMVRRADGFDKYHCEWCGRNDKELPSATACAGPRLGPLPNQGTLACNVGQDENYLNWNPRPIICVHSNPGDKPVKHTCKYPKTWQQCPRDKCKLIPG